MNIYIINSIIKYCQRIAHDKMPHHPYVVTIPDLHLDYGIDKNRFLGSGTNPAIYISSKSFHSFKKIVYNTYNDNEELMKIFDPESEKRWRKNKTLLLNSFIFNNEKRRCFFINPLEIIGIIIHEIGHAYNVAANISNTESNAYLFEIYVILNLYYSKHELFKNISDQNIIDYFEERLKQFRIEYSKVSGSLINTINAPTPVIASGILIVKAFINSLEGKVLENDNNLLQFLNLNRERLLSNSAMEKSNIFRMYSVFSNNMKVQQNVLVSEPLLKQKI